MWDALSGEHKAVLEGQSAQYTVARVGFMDGGRRVASLCPGMGSIAQVVIWSLSGEVVARIGKLGRVWSMGVSPNGRMVSAGSRIWDSEGTVLHKLKGGNSGSGRM